MAAKKELPVKASARVKCPRCGFENLNTDNYCSECGSTLIQYDIKELPPPPPDNTTMGYSMPKSIADGRIYVQLECPIGGMICSRCGKRMNKRNKFYFSCPDDQICFRCIQKEQAEANQKRRQRSHVTRKQTRSYKKSKSPGIPLVKELFFLRRLFG